MLVLQGLLVVVFGENYLELWQYLAELNQATIFVYIATASPDRRSIGATNGFAQMAVSITRTFGPAFATSFYSMWMERKYMRGCLVWWTLMGISTIAVACSTLLPTEVWDRPEE
jgi:hypothetical protein